MVLRRVGIAAAMLGLVFAAPAWSQAQNGGMPGEACLSSAESRDLFVADKLVAPFGVMREAGRATQAEAIDILLCRAQGTLVYDVTLLDQQGRVFHRLMNATTGAAMPSQPPAGPSSPPRPAYQAQRPAPDFESGPGRGFAPNDYFGPRFRLNMFPGQRPGPYGFPGPRQGAPFYPGARPGERVPGQME